MATASRDPSGAQRAISRRSFLNLLGSSGALLGGAALLAACAPPPPSQQSAPPGAAPGAPPAAAPAAAPKAASVPGQAPTAAPAAAPTTAPAAKPAQKVGGTLNWYLPDDPPDLDPHMQTTSSLQWVSNMIYNGLLKYDVKPGNTPDTPGASSVVPDLAERWEQPDPLTYIFHLRKGVKFHDGTEVTAEDAAFSLERIRTKKPEFQRAYAFEPLDTAEAVDKYTVRAKMKEPYAPFINQVAAGYTRVAPKAVIEKNGDMKQVMVGSGPFKLKEYVRGNRFVLEKNPEYFGSPRPYLDQLVIRILPDASAQLAAFNSKQIDVYRPLNAPEYQNIRRTLPGVGYIAFTEGNVNGIGLNVTQKPFDDIRVRQALWYAIDQDEVTKLAWNGEAYKHRAVPPAMVGWAAAYEQLPLADSPNLDKAKQLLADAGYPNGLEFDCKTVYRYTQREAQVVAEQLKKINVTMRVVDVEYGAYLNARNKTDFQAIAFALSPFGDVEDYTYALFHTQSTRNYGKWGHPELDKLMNAARQEMSEDKRKALYKPIQEELARQSYVLDVPRGYAYEVWHPHVKDFVAAANPERGLTYEHVWLDK